MKAVQNSIVTTLAIGVLLAFAPKVSGADTTESTEPAKAAKAHPPRKAQNELDHLSKELKLTQEQKDKIDPILKEEAQKVRDLRKDTALSAKDRRAKVQAIHEQAAGQIKQSLTPAQATQFAKLHSATPKAPHAKKAAPATDTEKNDATSKQ